MYLYCLLRGSRHAKAISPWVTMQAWVARMKKSLAPDSAARVLQHLRDYRRNCDMQQLLDRVLVELVAPSHRPLLADFKRFVPKAGRKEFDICLRWSINFCNIVSLQDLPVEVVASQEYCLTMIRGSSRKSPRRIPDRHYASTSCRLAAAAGTRSCRPEGGLHRLQTHVEVPAHCTITG